MKHGPILLIRLRRQERRLVNIRVELLLHWIGPLQAMFIQRLHEYRVGHFQAVVEGLEILIHVRRSELLRRDGGEGAVEIVDAVDEVLCEALERKVLGGLDFTPRAFLEVAEVGDAAEVFVL